MPVVAEALEAARKAAVDTSQIEILEAASREGRDVTYEEYLQAANAALDCLYDVPEITESGITEYTQDGGKNISIWLSTANGDDAADSVYNRCFGNCVNYVELAYQQRATVQEWRDSVNAQYIGAVRACIEDRGIVVDADWTIDDMLEAEDEQFPDGDVNARCAAVTGYERAITH